MYTLDTFRGFTDQCPIPDLSGNRRWLPFRIAGIDSPFTHDYPYEGIYAQADGFPVLARRCRRCRAGPASPPVRGTHHRGGTHLYLPARTRRERDGRVPHHHPHHRAYRPQHTHPARQAQGGPCHGTDGIYRQEDHEGPRVERDRPHGRRHQEPPAARCPQQQQ